MTDIPLLTFGGIVVGQTLAEYAAMLHTGTLRRKHRREWTYYAVVMPFKAVIGATLCEYVALHTQPTTALMVAGGALAATGIAIRVLGHLELHGAFSQYVERADGQSLVESGMYAKVRHPMYLGTILLFVGIPFVLGATWAWGFSVLGVVGIAVRIRKEEAFLAQELPGYREYMQRTWRLLPHVC